MTSKPEWTEEIYEASVSSRCWWCTIYQDGWEKCPNLLADNELKEIVAMERELGSIPEWAQQIVERSINFLPMCGHYLFPRPYLETLDAIGSQTPRTFVHGCFTVDQERKKQMMDYLLCLDAWLAGADPEAPARELTALGQRRIDWHTVCADLWKVLGERTELKELLVQRVLHQQRWYIKATVWDDDFSTEFGRDQYVGDYSETGGLAEENCYVGRPVPAFDEQASPRIQELEARLAEICPDWEWFRYTIRHGWLCAPKAFRFLERLLWAIGKERQVIHTHDNPMERGDKVPGFLQCQDTYPDPKATARWWKAFYTALKGWWRGKPERGDVAKDVNRRLGETTPVKSWLVRLLVRKLELPEGRAVVPRGTTKQKGGR